ncbi:SDR family NAD(P)-dependent oxidoreductase [Methylobacterium frigidaeris]|uniref:2-dehydro-3-deoxy-D-gluconate 5-dehydrogenase n=1 Tax=Methylobacterium frigidaeris TaxID=2038277 RepID=A0AA37M3U5_9HYPH|nr:SDR family oxidoreductase [Methylobacterium frigidaeris]PIK74047.1 2-deoxy-D-gluconate 3-dehydrogenase [Methylobacterium frigidaeris]GJD61106.1 2-dehydro-3-deoxy-D-gluconate 5-dehydrogenase [Methylobacterium frigidaeris]
MTFAQSTFAQGTFTPDLLAGRTALVTGATSGIGAGIAQALARLGARVHAAGIGAATCPIPDDLGLTAHELDVTDGEAVAHLVGACDRLDIVVNCAGIIRRGDEHRPEVFEEVLAVNLTGTMRVCAAARAKLAETVGTIVNTASMLSFFGGGLVPAYSASKGGVAQLTKSLAIAYAPDGIRVNAVAPGWIATPLTQALQDDPARAGPILARTPLGRWGTPSDVAAAVTFLVSPAAAFMTGVVLPVDGGYLIA